MTRSETISQEYYARSKQGEPSSEWQPLEEHVTNIAGMAGSSALVLLISRKGVLCDARTIPSIV